MIFWYGAPETGTSQLLGANGCKLRETLPRQPDAGSTLKLQRRRPTS